MRAQAPASGAAIGAEIAALIETLHDAEERLEALTAGEVDSVANSAGRTILLQRAQERLRHREAARQAAILEALPAHIALLDHQGRIVAVNDRWRSFADANALQGPLHAVGVSYLEVCERAARQGCVEALQAGEGIRAVLGGRSASYSIEYPCHSATEQRWFLLTVTPLEENGASGAIVMHANVSERARAQASTRRTAELLQAVVDSTPDLVFVKDLGSRYLLCNDAFARFVGRSIAEVIGRDDSSFFTAEEAAEGARSDLDVIESAVMRASEKTRTGTAGTRLLHVWKAPYRNERGELSGVIGIAHDVTEQRKLAAALEAEHAQLVAVEDVANIGSWSLDVAAGTYTWSTQTHRIFGTDPLHFRPTIASVRALIHPDDLAGVLAATGRSLKQPGPTLVIEHRSSLPDGAEKIIEQRCKVFFDAAGVPVRALGTCQDITERRRAERHLRESQSLLSMSGRLAHVGAWSIDLPATRVLWTDALALIHDEPIGFAPTVEQALGYYVPEHRGQVRAAFERCIEAGTAFDVEHEIITASGRRVWVRTIGEAVRDDRGAIRRIQGALQDLTEHKRAEQEVLSLAARLTDTLESISDGFVTLNREWQFTYINGQAERLLKVPREGLLGKAMWALFPETLGGANEAGLRRAMSGEHGVAFEARYGPAGAAFSVNCYPTEEGISVYFRDDSIKRAARQRLELLEACVSQFSDIVMITDAERRIAFVNDAFVRVTGFSREEALGNTARIVQGPLTDPSELARVRAAMDRLEPAHAELVNYNRDGSWFWAEVDVAPVGFDGDARSHFVIIKRDISDRKRDQDALRELNADLEARVQARTAELNLAREQAEQANRAKSSFLATMSHEIRTPMNGVIGMIDVLEQTNLRSSQVEIVKTVRESAHALLTIVDDVLDFSKIEAGQFQIDSEPMDVEAVVEGVCDTLDHLAQTKDVSLLLYTDPAIPARTFGDAARLRQVLLNLAGNAIKFSSSPKRRGRVSVRALVLARSAQQVTVEISVSDNGIGMDAETRSLLFMPFTQADAGTTRRFGGTGLGLSISKRLVELMGGTIVVDSELELGSTFAVRLALLSPPDAGASNAGGLELEGASCLVIGSDDRAAADRVAYLVHAGAQAGRARSAAAAIQWLEGCPLAGCVVIAADATESTDRTLAACRAACVSRPGLRVGFVAFEHRNHPAPADAPDGLGASGESLRRVAFLRTVARACGRPAREAPRLSVAESHTAPAPLDSPGEAGQKRLILIAEDNEINQRVLRKQLALLGFGADIAATGGEALEYLQRADYALLLTDLHMPQMDGYELAQAVRKSEAGQRRMPIVALTANAVKGEAKRCRDVGMDDYMAKPVQLIHLRAMLDKWAPLPRPGEADLDEESIAGPGEAQPQASAPADINVLTALVGSEPAVIAEMLQAFRRSAARSRNEIREAVNAGNGSAAANAAHMLKSGARSIGAERLGRICDEIEGTAEGKSPDALTEVLPRLEIEMDALDRFLDVMQRPEGAAASSPADVGVATDV